MKKLVIAVIVCCLMFSVTVPARALVSSVETEDGPFSKLYRGIMNVADAPLEIPGTIIRESKEKDLYAAITHGTVTGIVATLVRAVVGVFEIATFPAAIPKDYSPILDDPQFLSVE